MDLILKPVRVATSRPARQTYLNTLLFSIASSILLGLAVVAYILFYIEYIPQIGIERVVHLQYGDGPHPYGIALLDSSIVHDQAYDISLFLHVPRSPPNLAAGNFMISLSLLSPSYTPPPPSIAPPSPHQPPLSSTIPPSAILFTSRRPALIPYTSRLVSLPTRLLALPLYLLGLARESEALSIPMAESASFARGRRNLPARILLELHAASELQVYDVRVRFTARFAGLRWLMYNHRIVAFVIGTTAFWVAEMIFAVLGWLALRAYLEKGAGHAAVKEEEVDDVDSSDADLTSSFPGYGRARGLPATVKDEDSEESGLDEKAITEVAAELAEEDIKDIKDEKSLAGGKTDSAIGTSFSKGSGDAGVSRRKSKSEHAVE